MSPRTADRAARTVAVIGVGNTLMGDDGAGVEIVRRLAAAGLPDGVEAVRGETAGMALSRYFTGFDAVVFVDAVDCGADPGSLFVFAPDEADVTGMRSNNTHGMGIGHLLTTARLLGHDPDVSCVAVQVADVRPRPDTLSPQVTGALPRAVDLVRAEVVRLRRRARRETLQDTPASTEEESRRAHR